MAGRRTPRYLAVQENLVVLQRTLRGTDEAEDSLLDVFKSRGWLDPLAKTKADGLIRKALSKIENEVENYDLFIEMLQEVPGIDEAVEKITKRCPTRPQKDLGPKGNIKPEVSTDFVGFPEPELVDLINIVGVRVKVKWRSIGVGLGFEDWELDGIHAAKCSGLDHPQECMTEVFSQWKSGLKSEYSWKKLAEVLVSPAVDEVSILGHMYQKLTDKK